MSLHWKMHTRFPFTRVCILGIILFFLGLTSMIISIIAFVTHSWGHYVGTGMWGGSSILASGLTAIFASRLKSLASVKTFMISSGVAVFSSLTMLILSAGGLTLSSGFYGRANPTDYNKRTSNLIHASLLVISVFCLSGNVLAMIVCFKYVFFEHHSKPKHRRRHRNVSDGTIRSSSTLRGGAPNTSSVRSTSSRTPLHPNERSSRRHSDVDANRVVLEYRRSHRRTASDQPHNGSHSRRHRHHSHHEGISGHHSQPVATLCRYYPDRRSNRSDVNSLHRHVSDHCRESIIENKERERLNGVVLRQSGSSFQSYHSEQSRAQNFTQVRLPTDFDEEELPPYEAVVSSESQNRHSRSESDSGDESDTENSSSTDAHSYETQDVGNEGESVPMVDLRHSASSDLHGETSVAAILQETNSNCRNNTFDNTHAKDNEKQQGLSVSASHDLGTGGTMVMRSDSSQSNRPVLRYVNCSAQNNLGDYERLLSVSPEVCAITGESPLPEGATANVPHIMTENIYENNPCYENVSTAAAMNGSSNLNHLSKCSPTKLTQNASAESKTNVVDSEAGTLMKMAPLPMISPSSSAEVSSKNAQAARGGFGSFHSAFRPVGGASGLSLSPHKICSPSAVGCDQGKNTYESSSLQNNFTPSQTHYADSFSAVIPEKDAPTDCSDISSPIQTSQYVEQGAIPKSVKNRGSSRENNSSMSWKNIPLPLSYNHSECASNDIEKKLPSKTIPFTENCKETRRQSSPDEGNSSTRSKNKVESQNLLPSAQKSSSSSSSSSASSSSSSLLNVFACGSRLGKTSSKSKTQHHPTVTLQSSPPSSNLSAMPLLSRDTHCQSVEMGAHRSHFHRMGGNQSLLQSRREELQNSQLSSRAQEAPHSSSSLAISSTERQNLVREGAGINERQSGGASAPDDQGLPLSFRSYLVNQPVVSLQGQQQQQQQFRQNHPFQANAHHFAMQPQQPRLGVQLQHRRQQQHQIQQNLDLQQQHQQQQQQHHGNQQAQQASRNGRPLFSVIL